MSEAYRIAKAENPDLTMKQWCLCPGKIDGDGKPLYTTEQHHADSCDVNKIIRKYDQTGLLHHVNKMEATYGDVSGADFQAAQLLVAGAKTSFEKLPSNIRNRFSNSVQEYLEFFENPENRAEAIELGLVNADTPDDQDGIGEHVKDPKEPEKKIGKDDVS